MSYPDENDVIESKCIENNLANLSCDDVSMLSGDDVIFMGGKPRKKKVKKYFVVVDSN